LNSDLIINTIAPEKDVDGFHVVNVGRLGAGLKAMVPCTPLGSYMLLQDRMGDLSGKHAVVIGRSNIVGKPMGQLLLQANATVTIAHSRTKDLPEVCKTADILVAAVGRASCAEVAGAVTPVPGGIGPMTIACLLANTVTATARIHGLKEPADLTF